jgi:hypothetical protein
MGKSHTRIDATQPALTRRAKCILEIAKLRQASAKVNRSGHTLSMLSAALPSRSTACPLIFPDHLSRGCAQSTPPHIMYMAFGRVEPVDKKKQPRVLSPTHGRTVCATATSLVGRPYPGLLMIFFLLENFELSDNSHTKHTRGKHPRHIQSGGQL